MKGATQKWKQDNYPVTKSASSRLIKKEYPQIRQKLWKEYFWSQSFCLISTGEANIETIIKYIERQGEKHETK